MFNDTKTTESKPILPFYLAEDALDAVISRDIIAPGILLPGGVVAFGGDPEVGTTNLLLAWLAHMAAGIPFFGMTPPRPLKVVYLQGRDHYVHDSTQMDPEMLPLFKGNFFVIPRRDTFLDDDGIDLIKRTILHHVPDDKVDIIAIDPLYGFFEGTKAEIESMLYSHQDTLQDLRNAVNPKCGIIFVHDTQALTKQQMEEDAFYGFGEIQNISHCNISMLRSDASLRTLNFRFYDGETMKTRTMEKVSGKWCEVGSTNKKATE